MFGDEAPRDIFSLLDTNKDGVLTRREFAKLAAMSEDIDLKGADLTGQKSGPAAKSMSKEAGFEMPFGSTPMQFEKINLLGSGLSENAISQLVLSVPNLTVLDLRGNFLNAAFGWKLIKAMKQRYVQLEYCNGMHLQPIRDNTVDTLNLSNFSGLEHGLFGIEAVGAIFLAHFLRINSSLTDLSFRRNDVQKDGAKALAQSLIGNTNCSIRIVNFMGPTKCPSPERKLPPQRAGKPGVDFQLFRQGTLRQVNLRNRILDDDDFVFLEEWLRRYDCVTELDISDNQIFREGIRKLARYLKDTKTLKTLKCTGLPVDLDGAAMLVHGVSENQTLESAAISLGRCDENPDRQQMLQQMGVGLAHHPTLEKWGRVEGQIGKIRREQIETVTSNGLRNFAGWHRSEAAVYLWMVAACRPQSLEFLEFGPLGKPNQEHPTLTPTAAMVMLWPALCSVVHEVNSLKEVSISVLSGYGPLMMELMRALSRCEKLKKLHLLGYGGCAMREVQLPLEWQSAGPAPRWLMEEKIRHLKIRWQALYGLLSMLPELQNFNDITLEPGCLASLRENPQLLVLLLLSCVEGVAAQFLPDKTAAGEAVLKASLSKDADVEAFCNILRILHRNPIVVEVTIATKKTSDIRRQQERFIAPLCGPTTGESGPRFTHGIRFKNEVISDAVLQAVDGTTQLRAFGYERIHAILPMLYQALCGHERPLPVERIVVSPKWIAHHGKGFMRKRFSDRQRRWVEGIQSTLSRSEQFEEIFAKGTGQTVSREKIADMSLQEFAELLAGHRIDDLGKQEHHLAQTRWLCFTSRKHFATASKENPPLHLRLPFDEDGRNLRKLSLCMCGLRAILGKRSRPDEWPAPSKPLWRGPRSRFFPGQWTEFETQDEKEEELDGDQEMDGQNIHYHWREKLHLGTHHTASLLGSQRGKGFGKSFGDDLLHVSLRSLIKESPALEWLDVRGNYFDKEDASVMLDLLEGNRSLRFLNMIPLQGVEACESLELEGPHVEAVHRESMKEDSSEPENEAYTKDCLVAESVRLDEGDGYLMLHLLSGGARDYSQLRHIAFRHHDIPDHTLPHICDALLSLPNVEALQLSNLRLSSRGASLLLSAVAELAPRLLSLNGLPINRLLVLRDSLEAQGIGLEGFLEWNDFSLGAMARLNLWPAATLPVTVQGDFPLQGNSITDVGLRGLCAMLRYFSGPDRLRDSGVGKGALTLTRIDLSGNHQITDATVADLCQTLMHPMQSSTLRHNLKELTIRSCKRLKVRSSYELMQLVSHIPNRDARQETVAAGSQAPFSNSLQVVNGIDIPALQVTTKPLGGNSNQRASCPPLLLRTFVQHDDLPLSSIRPSLPDLSPCDINYYAAVMHMYPQIPHCHVHIVVPGERLAEKYDYTLVGHASDIVQWGRSKPADGSAPQQDDARRNDSPFPPPEKSSPASTRAMQAHIDAVKRLFEAAPAYAQLRVSMVPCVPGCEDLIAMGDPLALTAVSTGSGSQFSAGCFQKVQRRLKERGQVRKKKSLAREAKQGSRKASSTQRILYENNINAQRSHNCFRALYGQDDLEIEHQDIIPGECSGLVQMSPDVDVTELFGVATSIDLQHLDLGPKHFQHLDKVTEMPVLTHLNLSYNLLGDAGMEWLFGGLTSSGCNVVHISLTSNNIGDIGVVTIAHSLPHLPRLTSLELCENFIQERGSIVLAEAVGGIVVHDMVGLSDDIEVIPLPMLSIDLRGNHSRGLGAMRWAEVICRHPTLQFLSLAHNEVGTFTADAFLSVVYAAIASGSLTVLDLRHNFPALNKTTPDSTCGPPPQSVVEDLLVDLPAGEFDAQEVKQGVFIRRPRGASGGPADKNRRQPQQGQLGLGRRMHAAAGVLDEGGLRTGPLLTGTGF